MKVVYDNSVLHNPLEVLRRAGYFAFVDPKTGSESYVFRLSKGYYPRFHVYVETKGNETSLSLHLDQKKPSYGDGPAHGGEYSGPIVEKEMHRIDGWVAKLRQEQEDQPRDHEEDSPTRPWWKVW